MIGHSAGAHLAALTVLELSMKHLSDGPTHDTSQTHERRADSLQVSVIKASTFSPSSDILRMHERHFNGDTGSGEDCLCAQLFTKMCIFSMFLDLEGP